MSTQFERLTDRQWEFIKEYLPTQRKRRLDLREILNAILWLTRTGAQWRNLDSGFPNWKSVYYYFRSWTSQGIIEQINWALNEWERLELGRHERPSLGLVDSQSVKLAPMISRSRGIDGHKKVNGRKRQILTDTLGRIWKVWVHAANQHDSPNSLALLDLDQDQKTDLKKIIGDKAYRGTFANRCVAQNIEFEVPERPKATKGFAVEAKRWVVERTIAWFNFFRRIQIDYERTEESSAAFVYFANISMILAKFDNRTE